ncbi:hypothetical protein [Pantoea sp. GM01]|uniref:hypothetical protein n=1 Tax=Pantoea sp. GM01 TaxID=1144320 RepID=UPI000271077C|nr:hypothetical protein [Pantoea sp. GM01]EJL90278.1 hypothetical protein PMI17_01798 [Pantoea sp. GM01]
MKPNGTYHYPGSDAYTENLYTDDGLRRLASDSKIIRLLEELEQRGNNIGGARDEVNALLNYVKDARKIKGEMVTHLEYLLDSAKKL